jgi:hypothetical protein
MKTVAALFVDSHPGSLIKALNNLLATWFCGETQSLMISVT